MKFRSVTIGQLCEEDRTIVTPESSSAHDLPFLGLEHIESVTGRILREAMLETLQSNGISFFFDTQHVLYCKLRPYLNKVAVPDFAGRCTTELIPLRPRAGVSREFLAWILRRPQTVQAAMQERTGGRMPRANMRHIFAQQVLVPETVQDQQSMADEMTRRMNLIIQTRQACCDQLDLLSAYAQKMLNEFPMTPAGTVIPQSAKEQR
jgi:type I restriction enzyme S subunit